MILNIIEDDNFENEGLFEGKIVTGNIDKYMKRNPDSVVIKNANVFIDMGGKIWWGDLDLTRDAKRIQRACNRIGMEILITEESVGRDNLDDLNWDIVRAQAVAHIKPEL